MSAANMIGNGAYAGSMSSQELFKAVGVATMGVGAPATTVINIPYVKSTDTVVLSVGAPAVAGGTIAALTYTTQNSGLANASITLSATVAAQPVNVVYMVFAGQN